MVPGEDVGQGSAKLGQARGFTHSSQHSKLGTGTMPGPAAATQIEEYRAVLPREEVGLRGAKLSPQHAVLPTPDSYSSYSNEGPACAAVDIKRGQR